MSVYPKASGKRIDNWVRRKETKQLINYISKLPHIEEVNIIDIKEGKYCSIVNIPIQADGYINITKLCKAGGKKYFKWKEDNYHKIGLNISILI
jgi:hypothetical protein